MLAIPFSARSQVTDPTGYIPPDSPAATVTTDAVVRAWPNSGTEALGNLPARTIVPVNGRTPDSQWWRIPYSTGPQGNGWVAATVLQPNEAAAGVPVIEVTFVTPTPPPAEAAPSGVACTYDAAFVADVTVPDRTQVAPNQQVDKVWRVQNIGTCAWSNAVALVFVGGFPMHSSSEVAVPPTAAGATVDISVTLFAPTSPGSYQGTWQLRDPMGRFFGPQLTVVIDVPSGSPPPPQPGQPYINFWVDSGKVQAGQCTNLRWDVRNVKEVYVEGKGVTGQGSKQVCPCPTKKYALRAVLPDDSTQTRKVTVQVDGNCPEKKPKEEKQKIDLVANPSTIKAGECSTVSWNVPVLHKIFFDKQRFTSSQGSHQVCPTKTTSYRFTVCYEASCGKRNDYNVKVTVK
jgi:hypothetical protein